MSCILMYCKQSPRIVIVYFRSGRSDLCACHCLSRKYSRQEKVNILRVVRQCLVTVGGRRRKSHLFCCYSSCFCSLVADVCRSHAEVSRAGATRSNSHLRRSVPLRTTVTACDVWRWNGKDEDTKITKTSDTKKENNRNRSTLSNKMQLMFRKFRRFFLEAVFVGKRSVEPGELAHAKAKKDRNPISIQVSFKFDSLARFSLSKLS